MAWSEGSLGAYPPEFSQGTGLRIQIYPSGDSDCVFDYKFGPSKFLPSRAGCKKNRLSPKHIFRRFWPVNRRQRLVARNLCQNSGPCEGILGSTSSLWIKIWSFFVRYRGWDLMNTSALPSNTPKTKCQMLVRNLKSRLSLAICTTWRLQWLSCLYPWRASHPDTLCPLRSRSFLS